MEVETAKLTVFNFFSNDFTESGVAGSIAFQPVLTVITVLIYTYIKRQGQRIDSK